MKKKYYFFPPLKSEPTFHNNHQKDTKKMFLPPFRIFKILLAYCIYKTVPTSLLFPLQEASSPALSNSTVVVTNKRRRDVKQTKSRRDVDDRMHPGGLRDMMYFTLVL